MEMYDNKDVFDKSWIKNYLSEESIQAQWAEFVELKRSLQNCTKKETPLSILISELSE
jgi:hypothetical protein